MTQAEFDAECRKLCAHCAANEKVRWRDNTREFVHDFAFGNVDPKIGRRVGMGHTICGAHAYREKYKDQVVG